MTSKLVISIVLLGSLTIAPLAFAEVVQIPIGQQAAELNQVQRPKTGTTKARVAEQFGEPIAKKEARGEPPISSWEYADFVVYFENDHVIHSVLKHRPILD